MQTDFLRTRAEIDLDALRENFREIKSKTGDTKIIGVVKANAYGHGATKVCRVLKEEGVDMFAVSSLDEAEEVRSVDSDTPILILGYTVESAAKKLAENGIIQTVFSLDYAKALDNEAKSAGVTVKCHLALDCGMGRIGFPCDDLGIAEAYEVSKLENLEIKGVFTHFPSADFDNDEDGEITEKQYKKFFSSVEKLEKTGIKFEMRHASNSASILSKPYARLDAVRAGIIMYGMAPSGALTDAMHYRPVMKLITKVGHIKEINKGDTVSYGMTFTADRKMTVATLAIGYADGYQRALHNDAVIKIGENKAKIIGRICMDQLMVDITDMKGIKRGDDAVVMGDFENTADILAKILNTINYEVVCLVSHRVPRVYRENGEIIGIENYLKQEKQNG